MLFRSACSATSLLQRHTPCGEGGGWEARERGRDKTQTRTLDALSDSHHRWPKGPARHSISPYRPFYKRALPCRSNCLASTPTHTTPNKQAGPFSISRPFLFCFGTIYGFLCQFFSRKSGQVRKKLIGALHGTRARLMASTAPYMMRARHGECCFVINRSYVDRNHYGLILLRCRLGPLRVVRIKVCCLSNEKKQ